MSAAPAVHTRTSAPEVDRAAWLALRRSSIGGSDAPPAVGMSPWKSPTELFLEKTGQIEPEDISLNPRVYWGNALEDVVVREAAKRNGLRLVLDRHEATALITLCGGLVVAWVDGRQPLIRSASHDWRTCTLDGLAVGGDGTPYLIQAKTTDARNAPKWDSSAPDDYDIQVRHELSILPHISRGLLAVLIGGNDYRDFEIVPEPSAAEALIEVEAHFWACVQRQDIDGLDDSSALGRAARTRLSPLDSGLEIELPEEALDWCAELEAAKEQRRKAESTEKELKERISAHIGNATFGLLTNGRRYSLKTTSRKGYVVEPCNFRTLRLEAQPKN